MKKQFDDWKLNMKPYLQRSYRDKALEIKKNWKNTIIIPVIDYGEYLPVVYDTERETIIAFNEGGFCATEIDAKMLYEWLKEKYEK